jgi:hypothetical protein
LDLPRKFLAGSGLPHHLVNRGFSDPRPQAGQHLIEAQTAVMPNALFP